MSLATRILAIPKDAPLERDARALYPEIFSK